MMPCIVVHMKRASEEIQIHMGQVHLFKSTPSQKSDVRG